MDRWVVEHEGNAYYLYDVKQGMKDEVARFPNAELAHRCADLLNKYGDK